MMCVSVYLYVCDVRVSLFVYVYVSLHVCQMSLFLYMGLSVCICRTKYIRVCLLYCTCIPTIGLKIVRQQEPDYFKDSIDLLATLPDKFDLAQEGNPKYKIVEAAHIFRYILKHEPKFFDEEIDLGWLAELETDELITYIIR